MADTKISELPVATVIASPDVAPVVRNGVTKRADVSLFGRPFLSANTARVDPSGNDATGTVGSLELPFLTAQAALTALENSGIPFSAIFPPVLLLPMQDSFDPVTTSLSILAMIGLAPTTLANPAIGSVTLTNDGTATGGFIISLHNLYIGDLLAPNLDPGFGLDINVDAAVISGNVTVTGSLNFVANYNCAIMAGTVSPGAGKDVLLRGFRSSINDSNQATITAPGSQVTLIDSYVSEITDAGTIIMQDSIIGTNSSGVTPSYNNFFTNPAFFDFSSLPTSAPTEVGKAWIDTTGGFNIVKVKL